jgi:aminoglycoside 3-N-acetyltransferase I
MSYSYKQLTSGDILLFKELLRVFGEAFEEISTYQDAIPSDTYLKSLLGKNYFIALVAQDGGSVVGGLAAYVLEKFEQERKEVYIYDLAVSKNHRRRGVATELIKQLKQIGKERGAYIIFVQADKVDTPAIKLYESLGTREDVYHFDITVN